MSTSFITNLNEYSYKYLIKGSTAETWEDVMLFPSKTKSVKSSLFESLMLFDKVNIKVVGQNIPLAVMIVEMGVRGIEDLVDQGAIEFTHWTPIILHFEKALEGVYPLASGRHDSPAHCDPEESIKIGLNSLVDNLNKRERTTLTRKLRDLYIYPESDIEHDSSNIVKSAYESNKLAALGLDKNLLDIYNLSASQIRVLATCATELLEYKYISGKQLSSTDNFNSLKIFLECSESIEKNNHVEAFSKILQLEKFPDLKVVYDCLEFPLKEVCKLRSSKNARKFRSWLDNVSGPDEVTDISQAYIQALINRRGFFETNKGKLTKTVVLALAGAGLGSVTGPAGAALGGVIGSAISPAADLALDLVDQYFLSDLIKGWTPKMFIDDLKKIKIEPKI